MQPSEDKASFGLHFLWKRAAIRRLEERELPLSDLTTGKMA
jgi:ubiquinone/menaquinone biosynthesis C-methylase UbiE